MSFLPSFGLQSPDYLYKILPYFITMLILAFTSKKSRAPKAEGIPYDPGKR
jgi:general nucleoside transport system permease protein